MVPGDMVFFEDQRGPAPVQPGGGTSPLEASDLLALAGLLGGETCTVQPVWEIPPHASSVNAIGLALPLLHSAISNRPNFSGKAEDWKSFDWDFGRYIGKATLGGDISDLQKCEVLGICLTPELKEEAKLMQRNEKMNFQQF